MASAARGPYFSFAERAFLLTGSTVANSLLMPVGIALFEGRLNSGARSVNLALNGRSEFSSRTSARISFQPSSLILCRTLAQRLSTDVGGPVRLHDRHTDAASGD